MKRKANARWQPYQELTAAAAAASACGGHTSLLGGGRGHGIVERKLLSQFKGDTKLQVTDDRPEPSLVLSLRVGAEEEPQPPPPQPQNHLRYAPTRHSPSLLPAGSSVPVPPQTYAPCPAPAGAGLAPPPPPQLGSNSSLQLELGVGATPLPQPGCDTCIYDSLAAYLLKRVSEDLDHKLVLLRQELIAEVRKEVLRLHAAAAAFSAASLPPQPCSVGGGGGGAWRRCPGCGARPGTLVLKPCEHLCLCAQCSPDASRVCLVCSFAWTGAVDAASHGRGRGRGRGGSLPSWPGP